MNILFVIPGEIDTPTGGYRYDRKIINAWRSSGHSVELIQLDGEYPFPSATEKSEALDKLSKHGPADVAVIDGLAGGAHPELFNALHSKMPVVALVHHPLCLEEGIQQEEAATLKHSEKAALGYAAGIVTTSPTTARTVSDMFDIAAENIAYVLPGVERIAISSPSPGPIRLLCVGSIIERKGHSDLIRALSSVKDRNWHLDCVGSANLDPKLFLEISGLSDELGLSDRISFHGSLPRNDLIQLYQSAHVFVLPSKYEGYGMAYAEAIVAGLPVIGTTGGAIPDTVPAHCGIGR